MDTIVRYNLYNVGEAAAVDVKLTDAGKTKLRNLMRHLFDNYL